MSAGEEWALVYDVAVWSIGYKPEKEKRPTEQEKPGRLQAVQEVDITNEGGVVEGKSDDDPSPTNGNGLE
ncbi:hypothetical protein Taro_021531 [Colocasia esculenta]|uniref:Uncharacterized protein n=1 Tax=Colocasia esculenta TaxID=4460 RepID=A0A843V5L9_COLES|nr:hypothetical protein [Colocasia esculenta]